MHEKIFSVLGLFFKKDLGIKLTPLRIHIFARKRSLESILGLREGEKKIFKWIKEDFINSKFSLAVISISMCVFKKTFFKAYQQQMQLKLP